MFPDLRKQFDIIPHDAEPFRSTVYHSDQLEYQNSVCSWYQLFLAVIRWEVCGLGPHVANCNNNASARQRKSQVLPWLDSLFLFRWGGSIPKDLFIEPRIIIAEENHKGSNDLLAYLRVMTVILTNEPSSFDVILFGHIN